ncbi:MAG: CDGSH iron-sulfur domain-containing protein [Flavobacteriaceae bacterium]
MEKVTLEVFDNGRIRVYNADFELVTLVDEHGNPLPHGKRFTLCGCGKTTSAPFCDGSHKASD